MHSDTECVFTHRCRYRGEGLNQHFNEDKTIWSRLLQHKLGRMPCLFSCVRFPSNFRLKRLCVCVCVCVRVWRACVCLCMWLHVNKVLGLRHGDTYWGGFHRTVSIKTGHSPEDSIDPCGRPPRQVEGLWGREGLAERDTCLNSHLLLLSKLIRVRFCPRRQRK